jgi:type IV prepilin leader peptidase
LTAGLAAGRAAVRAACSCQGLCRWQRVEVVQILCAAVYLLLYARFGVSGEFFWFSILAAMLLGLAVTDVRSYRLPNDVILWVCSLGGLYCAAGHMEWKLSAAGCLTGIALFGALCLLSRGGIGCGDVKLAGALGIWFGVRGILQITALAFMAAACVGSLLLVVGRKTKKDPIALGPYFCVGTILTMLCAG